VYCETLPLPETRHTLDVYKRQDQLYEATKHINRADFSHRIAVQSSDQLATLANSFNSMTTSIEKLVQEQKEKQRLEGELAIAQEVQAQLYPKLITQLETLEVHGFCRPARTVSGDYYDFLALNSDKLMLAVGDISGKGISAALLMATIHSAVRAYSIEDAPVLREPVAVAAGGSRLMLASESRGADTSPATLLTLLNHQPVSYTHLDVYKRQPKVGLEIVFDKEQLLIRLARLFWSTGYKLFELTAILRGFRECEWKCRVTLKGELRNRQLAARTAGVSGYEQQFPVFGTVRAPVQVAVSYTHLDVYKRQRQCWGRALLLGDAVRDLDPSRFLLLPHGHHVLRRRGERLRAARSIQAAVQSDGVGHDDGVSIQLGPQIAERIVFQPPLTILLKRGRAIERPARSFA